MARLMRDSSPPEAIFVRDFGFWPGLALIRKLISSFPYLECSFNELISISNTPPGMPSSAMASETNFDNLLEALIRPSVSSFACLSYNFLDSLIFFSILIIDASEFLRYSSSFLISSWVWTRLFGSTLCFLEIVWIAFIFSSRKEDLSLSKSIDAMYFDKISTASEIFISASTIISFTSLNLSS